MESLIGRLKLDYRYFTIAAQNKALIQSHYDPFSFVKDLFAGLIAIRLQSSIRFLSCHTTKDFLGNFNTYSPEDVLRHIHRRVMSLWRSALAVHLLKIPFTGHNHLDSVRNEHAAQHHTHYVSGVD